MLEHQKDSDRYNTGNEETGEAKPSLHLLCLEQVVKEERPQR